MYSNLPCKRTALAYSTVAMKTYYISVLHSCHENIQLLVDSTVAMKTYNF